MTTKELLYGIQTGASSDWAATQLLGTYELFNRKSRLGGILCVGRTMPSEEEYRQQLAKNIYALCKKEQISSPSEHSMKQFLQKIFVLQANPTIVEDWVTIEEVYRAKIANTGRIFLINCVACNVAIDVLQALSQTGFIKDVDFQWDLMFEKPYGSTVEEALQFKSLIYSLNPKDVFLIDHYLSKFLSHALATLLRGSAARAAVVKEGRIHHTEFSALEGPLDPKRWNTIESNGGATYDMVLSHLLHIVLILVMDMELRKMETPLEQKIKHFVDLVNSIEVKNIYFAQYEKGEIRGEAVCGYRELNPKLADSRTPTFTAIEIVFGIGPHAGKSVYISSGKGFRRKDNRIKSYAMPPETSPSGLMEVYEDIFHEEDGENIVRNVFRELRVVRTTDLEYDDHLLPSVLDPSSEGGGDPFATYAKIFYDALKLAFDGFAHFDVVIAILTKFEPYVTRFKEGEIPLHFHEAGIHAPEVPWWPKND